MSPRIPHVTAVPADISTLSEAPDMPHPQLPEPRGPNHDRPEESEPPPQPIDPREWTTPVHLPGDTADDREIDPSAAQGGRQLPTPPRGAKAPRSPAGLALPHERDESIDAPPDELDPKMIQAQRDIDAGLVDTDMRATPGLDAERRADMVPGPSGKGPPRRH